MTLYSNNAILQPFLNCDRNIDYSIKDAMLRTPIEPASADSTINLCSNNHYFLSKHHNYLTSQHTTSVLIGSCAMQPFCKQSGTS